MKQNSENFSPLTRSEFDMLTGSLSRLLSTTSRPVIIPSEAILGIEAIAAGVSAPGRTILNIVTGPYGAIFGKWLARGGAKVVTISTSFDEVVTADEVAAAVDRYKPCALAFVQAEAVTGGSNPASSILQIARQSNIITIMDSVSAIGAEPVLMDKWDIDFVAIGAQKALSGPNGISAVGVSERGWAFLAATEKAPRDSILSLIDLNPDHRAVREQVPANIPILEARALIKTLERVEQEGLPAVNRRHELASSSAIAGIEALGLEPWQRNNKWYSPLVTTVRIPQGSNLNIERPVGIVAPGDGELRDKLLRINHFGANANQESIEEATITLAKLAHRDPHDALLAERSIWENEDGE